LEIIYFPPRTRVLNPQEHVWEATRRAISHNHSCKKLDKLANDFEDHLSTTSFAVLCSTNMPTPTCV
jgi:hypothetical protein